MCDGSVNKKIEILKTKLNVRMPRQNEKIENQNLMKSKTNRNCIASHLQKRINNLEVAGR